MVPTREGRLSKEREVVETKRISAAAGFTSRAFQEASRKCSCTVSSVDEALILHMGCCFNKAWSYTATTVLEKSMRVMLQILLLCRPKNERGVGGGSVSPGGWNSKMKSAEERWGPVWWFRAAATAANWRATGTSGSEPDEVTSHWGHFAWPELHFHQQMDLEKRHQNLL